MPMSPTSDHDAAAAGLALHFHELSSDGPPVILLHGLFGDGDNLGSLGRELAVSHRVILADLRNHGASPHSDSMSLAEMAADVAMLQDRLGLTASAVVGHSLGGKVAMQLALSRPQRVTRLVVADIAPVRYEPHHQQILAALQAVDFTAVSSRGDADRQLARHLDELPVRQFLLKSLQRDGSGGYRWCLNLPVLVSRYESQLNAAPTGQPYPGPALFIKGELSDYITADHSEAMQRLFPGLTFKIIGGTGHWLHNERPETFNRLVSEFLQEAAGAPG